MKGWAKTTRICVMMALDTVFLAIELGVGYYVSSLALIADGFHMLNDIISLAVGLWAVNLARKESNDRFSYGWLRAEILGAFFNATFLIGLCVTIVLEAIQRFFEPPNISNPEIVLVVGFCGLVSNLVGFWVLGGHGHSHGGADEEAGHDHAHDDHSGSEHVHAHDHSHDHGHAHADSAVEDSVDDFDDPDHCRDEDDDEELAVEATRTDGPIAIADRPAQNAEGPRHVSFIPFESRGGVAARSASRGSAHSRGASTARRRANSGRRVPTTIEDISIHPASFRQDLQEMITARQTREVEDETDSDSAGDNSPAEGTVAGAAAASATERTPLLGKPSQLNGASDSTKLNRSSPNGHDGHNHSHSHDHDHGHSHDHDGDAHAHSHAHAHAHPYQRPRRDSHGGHHHSLPKDPSKAGGHGHSHGDMGMNAMVLHVIGDALGNIGVIVTALIIWKTTWAYRMYADPAVSLLITAIILRSAIPLTKATSKILLQATPDHIDINDIREDIQDLDGVLSCHHVHVWQLSDSQIVASMHVEVSFPISEYGGEKYMKLARRIRKCLHGYGIHSATIQPEFRLEQDAAGSSVATGSGSGNGNGNENGNGFGTGSNGSHYAGQQRGRPSYSHGKDGEEGTSAGAVAGAADLGDDGGGAGDGVSVAKPTVAAAALAAAEPSCLLDCVDDCVGLGCCSQTSRAGSRTGSPPNGSSHHKDHDGHSH